LYVAAGLLLVALSLPLIWGKVGPNPWYGFRVRRTLRDPAVWYPANAFAGKCLLYVGLAIAVIAALLALVPGIDVEAYATAVAVVALGGLAIAAVLSFRFLATIVDRDGNKVDVDR
jgi:uncharacterized membrane protein